MSSFEVAVSRMIPAPPAAVYRLLANYQTEHPRILPKPYFASLTVEEGGIGAGTVYRAEMHVLGAKQTLHMTVSEPEPGRVLMESDPAAGIVTTFTITPLMDGTISALTIATVWQTPPGLRGLGQRLMTPPITRRIYHKELDLIVAYLRPATATAQS
jgi:hypothetical protein